MAYTIEQLTDARNRAMTANDTDAVVDLDSRIAELNTEVNTVAPTSIGDTAPAYSGIEDMFSAEEGYLGLPDNVTVAPEALTQQEQRMGSIEEYTGTSGETYQRPGQDSLYAKTGYGPGMPFRDVDAELPTAEDFTADNTFTGAHYATTATGRGNEIMRNVRTVQENGERKTHMTLGDGYEYNGEFYPMAQLQQESDQARNLTVQGQAINEAVTPDDISNLDETSGIFDSFKAYASNPAYLAGSMVRPVTGFAIASAVNPFLGGAISYDQATEDAMTSIMLQRDLDPYSLDTAEMLKANPELHDEMMLEARIEGGIMATADMVSMKVAGKALGKVKTPATAPASTWTGIGQRTARTAEGAGRYVGAQVAIQPAVYGGATALAGKDSVEIGQAMAGGIMQPAMTGPVAMARQGGIDPVTGRLTTPPDSVQLQQQHAEMNPTDQGNTEAAIRTLVDMRDNGVAITPAVLQRVETQNKVPKGFLTGNLGKVRSQVDKMSQQASGAGLVTGTLIESAAATDAKESVKNAEQALNRQEVNENLSTPEGGQEALAVMQEARRRYINDEIDAETFNQLAVDSLDLTATIETTRDMSLDEMQSIDAHNAWVQEYNEVDASMFLEEATVLREMTKAGQKKQATAAENRNDVASIVKRFSPSALGLVFDFITPAASTLLVETGSMGARLAYRYGKMNTTERVTALEEAYDATVANDAVRETYLTRNGVQVVSDQMEQAYNEVTDVLIDEPLFEAVVEEVTSAPEYVQGEAVVLPQEVIDHLLPQIPAEVANEYGITADTVNDAFNKWAEDTNAFGEVTPTQETLPVDETALPEIVEVPVMEAPVVEVVPDVVVAETPDALPQLAPQQAPVTTSPVVDVVAPVVDEAVVAPAMDDVFVGETVTPDEANAQTVTTLLDGVDFSKLPAMTTEADVTDALSPNADVADRSEVAKALNIFSDADRALMNHAGTSRSITTTGGRRNAGASRIAMPNPVASTARTATQRTARIEQLSDAHNVDAVLVEKLADINDILPTNLHTALDAMMPHNTIRRDKDKVESYSPATQQAIILDLADNALRAVQTVEFNADGSLSNNTTESLYSGFGDVSLDSSVKGSRENTRVFYGTSYLADVINYNEALPANEKLFTKVESEQRGSDSALVAFEITDKGMEVKRELDKVYGNAKNLPMNEAPAPAVIAEDGSVQTGGYGDARDSGRPVVKQGWREYKAPQSGDTTNLMNTINTQANTPYVSKGGKMATLLEVAENEGVYLDGMMSPVDAGKILNKGVTAEEAGTYLTTEQRTDGEAFDVDFSERADRMATMSNQATNDTLRSQDGQTVHLQEFADGSGRLQQRFAGGINPHGNAFMKPSFEYSTTETLTEDGKKAFRDYTVDLADDVRGDLFKEGDLSLSSNEKFSPVEKDAIWNEMWPTWKQYSTPEAFVQGVKDGNVPNDPQFQSALAEYARMEDTGDYSTAKALRIDATSSGVQIASLITRDPTLAKSVNVIDPGVAGVADIYGNGAENLRGSLNSPQTPAMESAKEIFEKNGIDYNEFTRKAMKLPVMTSGYSATASAFAKQMDSYLSKTFGVNLNAGELKAVANAVSESVDSVMGKGTDLKNLRVGLTNAFYDAVVDYSQDVPTPSKVLTLPHWNGQSVTIGRKARKHNDADTNSQVESALEGKGWKGDAESLWGANTVVADSVGPIGKATFIFSDNATFDPVSTNNAAAPIMTFMLDSAIVGKLRTESGLEQAPTVHDDYGVRFNDKAKAQQAVKQVYADVMALGQAQLVSLIEQAVEVGGSIDAVATSIGANTDMTTSRAKQLITDILAGKEDAFVSNPFTKADVLADASAPVGR